MLGNALCTLCRMNLTTQRTGYMNMNRSEEDALAPFVSILVPTYNRADMLDQTLDSLLNQNYPKDKFELIVIDNNSSDHTREIVTRWRSRSHVDVKYILEERQGVHYARNIGAHYARGDILYFTDDDMVADPHVLQEIVKPFTYSQQVACVTGRVLPKWHSPPADWVRQLCTNSFLSLIDLPEDLLISSSDCGVYSCHQAVRRKVLFQAGVFNPENTAGEWIGDGETGLNLKIQELGLLFAYTRRAVTYHMIPESRTTQDYLNRRLTNQANCDSYTAYRRRLPTPIQLFTNNVKHVKDAFLHSMKFVVKMWLGRPSWRLNRAWISYHIQHVRSNHRILFDSDWRQLVLKEDWLSEDQNRVASAVEVCEQVEHESS